MFRPVLRLVTAFSVAALCLVGLGVSPAMAAPANDNWADATVMDPPPDINQVHYFGSNVGATVEPDESTHADSTWDGGPYHSVWWTWTAPEPGLLFVNTINTGFSAVLEVLDASDMSRVAQSDGSPTTITVAAGKRYLFAVDGATASAVGNISLNVQFWENAPPVLSLTSPAEGSYYPPTVPLAGQVTDSHPFQVKVAFAGPTSVPEQIIGASGGSFSTTSAALAPGTWTLTFTAYDQSLTASTPVLRHITVADDTTAPTLTVDAPTEGSSTTDGTPALSGTHTDANPDHIVVTFAGPGSVAPQTITDTDGGSWSATAPTLAPGTWTLAFAALDKLGNQSAVVTRHLTVTGPPTPPTGPAGRTIYGTPGADVLYGTEGDDVIYALKGNDKVYGLGGNDTIIGGAGNDKLFGGDGDDVMKAGKGTDVCKGEAGTDVGKGCERKRTIP